MTMDYLFQIEQRKKLSFCEANILIENVNQKTTQGDFIARLDALFKNTQDERLLAELNALLGKITDLTPQEFLKLKRDTLSGDVLFPADYII